MEHRCGKRNRLRFPVTLVTATGAPVRGVACNISAGGMYIEHLSDALQPWEFVDIMLRLPEPGARLWRWPAMVVRSTNDAAGLMFDRLRFGDLQRLLAALRQARSLPVPLPLSSPAMPAGQQRWH